MNSQLRWSNWPGSVGPLQQLATGHLDLAPVCHLGASIPSELVGAAGGIGFETQGFEAPCRKRNLIIRYRNLVGIGI